MFRHLVVRTRLVAVTGAEGVNLGLVRLVTMAPDAPNVITKQVN